MNAASEQRSSPSGDVTKTSGLPLKLLRSKEQPIKNTKRSSFIDSKSHISLIGFGIALGPGLGQNGYERLVLLPPSPLGPGGSGPGLAVPEDWGLEPGP